MSLGVNQNLEGFHLSPNMLPYSNEQENKRSHNSRTKVKLKNPQDHIFLDVQDLVQHAQGILRVTRRRVKRVMYHSMYDHVVVLGSAHHF